MRRAALVYGVGRIGLFLVVALLLWGIADLAGRDLNGLPLALAAALISSAVGYVVFAPQRRELAESLQAQREAKSEQIAQRRARLENES